MTAPTFDNAKAIVLLVAAGAVAYLGYRAFTVGKEVVTKDLNPANRENVVNRAVTAVAENFVSTDDKAPGRNADGSWTVGGYLYDLFNKEKATARDNFGVVAPASRAVTYPKGGM